MRHAKSSWADEGLRDFDRPLNRRGKEDAPRMGDYLAGLGIIPELVISSPAKRAKETANAVCGRLDYDLNRVSWNEDLYFGSSIDYVNAIRSAPDDVQTVMTVGHNPMAADAMAGLATEYFDHRVPTATIACFEVELGSWQYLESRSCRLLWVISPKEL